MRAIAGLLLTAMLAMSAGCAKTDWIDRTLVTVDVTGTWYGGTGGAGPAGDFRLELKQEGSRVTGFVRTLQRQGAGTTASWAIDGTVAGDVFRFKDVRGDLEGELTVSGDEMIGQASFAGTRSISLRRVDPSSRPASPPR